MPPTALRVSQLCKVYGDKTAVDDLTFQVERHQIVGLLGPNGAGKTTTINMVLGVLEPSQGTIEIDGIDLRSQRTRALERTNFVAVYAPLPGNLTVRENLQIFGLLYNVTHLRDRIQAAIKRFDLLSIQDRKCGLLSSGEQTRVAIAKAMLNQPTLLLLDEPTASLDPASAQDIRGFIKDFVSQNETGVLWTSHNMSEVTEVCDQVLFLSHGKILLQGSPRTLPASHGRSSLEDLFIAVAREPLSI